MINIFKLNKYYSLVELNKLEVIIDELNKLDEHNLMEQQLSYYVFDQIKNLLENIFLQLGMVKGIYSNDMVYV